jgi:hypothetical protein
MHLFNESGIPRETAGIEIAHLLDQGLQLLPLFGIILNGRANLIESVQRLVDLTLGIGWVRA